MRGSRLMAPVPRGRYKGNMGATAYRQNLDVAWRRIKDHDSAILVLPSSCNVVGLSDVATRVWELIEDWTDADSIVTALAAEYDAPGDQIAADVAAFLAALQARGLVEARA
jgi:formylglycine-generating enzyme required for sulfatase activity